MRDFFKWLSGLSFIAFVVALVRQWGVASEKERQYRAGEKKRKENQKLFKEIAQKHEEFRTKQDVESARQSFLNR